MNNNLRFPISELAQELYSLSVVFAKSANTNELENNDVTVIDEDNKYELRFNNYQKYLKKGDDTIRNGFYTAYHNVTEKGHSIILCINEFKLRRLSFSGEHLEMRKKGYEYFCYPSKRNVSFIFISPSGSIKFNTPSKNKVVWLSLSNIKFFPFNFYCANNNNNEKVKLSKKLLFNNKKNEWCENHIGRISSREDRSILTTQTNFTKSIYGSCSNLQQFINKIKTIDEPLSYKQFKDLSFDEIYEIMSVVPIFKNPVNFIDNFSTFKKLKSKNSDYSTYFEDLIKIANEIDNKINFSLNESNVKEQHDKMLLENLDKMKAKQIHVDEKFLILENYLPKQFKMIKNGKELLFEGLIQKHCVNNYSSNINRGQCCILTTEYDEKRYTAEIHFGKSWLANDNEHIYRIVQFKGYANSSVPNKLNSKLQEIIDEVNKKEKKYIKKKEVLNTSLNEHNYEVVEYIDNPF